MENQSNIISFKLQSAKIEKSLINEENYLEAQIFDISTSIGVAVYNTEKLIGVFLEIEYLQSEKMLVNAKISCHFEFTEETWKNMLDIDQSNIIIPKDFFGHLVGLTLGTMRGVLISKTEGTVFSTFVLPIIETSELIKEDGKFSILENNG